MIDDGDAFAIELAAEDGVEVVGLVAGPVVGDPVLREVVRADPLTAVDGADLAGAVGGGIGLRLLRAAEGGHAAAARALIGKEEGDTAEVQAPGGIRRYEVVAVSYQ